MSEETQAYRKGKEAFKSDKTANDNPFSVDLPGNKRTQWYTGYYDARTAHRLKKVFENHAIQYP